MGSSSNSDNRLLSWKELKEKGTSYYENQMYEEALESYRLSLAYYNNSSEQKQQGQYKNDMVTTNLEKQRLLSNIVACRLKLGTRAQAEVALIDAERCVLLNESWPKGHVRLASVYIKLNRSNDAYNSLQLALALDPSNQIARNMLTSQLRRDRDGYNNSNNNNNDVYSDSSAPPYNNNINNNISIPPLQVLWMINFMDNRRRGFAGPAMGIGGFGGMRCGGASGRRFCRW